MPGQPEISIIVPCFNYAHFLPETLRTVLAQHFQDWECIVVDDGSTDGTAGVSEEFLRMDRRFRYLSQTNSGLSAARNTGLREARGRYVQLLDADDGIAAQKLSLQHAYLEAHPEADLVYGNALFFEKDMSLFSDKRKEAVRARRATACNGTLISGLVKDNMMEVSCPLIRRTLLNRVGDFDPAYKSFEDWQYWFRCAMAGACFHYDGTGGTETFIRHGHASMMKNLARMNEAGFQIRMFMSAHLHGADAWYNKYRLLRLRLKKIWLSLQS